MSREWFNFKDVFTSVTNILKWKAQMWIAVNKIPHCFCLNKIQVYSEDSALCHYDKTIENYSLPDVFSLISRFDRAFCSNSVTIFATSSIINDWMDSIYELGVKV